MNELHTPGSVGAALRLILAVWCILVAGYVAAPAIGVPAGRLASFALAAGVVWWVRPGSCSACFRRPTVRAIGAGAVGILAGVSFFPSWLWLSWKVGAALGLDPAWLGDPIPPFAGNPLAWTAGIVLAPAFEEPLYRERLLGALRPRLGPALAIVLSSVLFAIPHLAPWSMLGTFLGGLMLGVLWCIGGSLVPCIGLHAGFNLAAVLFGVPASGLGPLAGACLGLFALSAALWFARSSRGVFPPFRKVARDGGA